LRKILQILNKKGILKSYKGLGGGFLLARPRHKIFLLDLIEIFQGPLKLNECIFKKMVCPNTKRCVLKKKIDDIERYVISQLGSITIASLLR
jgi:Rrf2 family protein